MLRSRLRTEQIQVSQECVKVNGRPEFASLASRPPVNRLECALFNFATYVLSLDGVRVAGYRAAVVKGKPATLNSPVHSFAPLGSRMGRMTYGGSGQSSLLGLKKVSSKLSPKAISYGFLSVRFGQSSHCCC